MKSATRALLHATAPRGSDWHVSATAEQAARRNAAALAAPAVGDSPQSSTAPVTAPAAVPLDASPRVDPSRVRLHTTGPRSEAAAELGARAFAHGTDIAFASGEFAPQRAASQQLLAHELTHVAQQAETGRPALQFEPKKEKAGIGAMPPEADFIRDPGHWGAEDGHVLFKHDQAEPEGSDDTLRRIAGATTSPVQVQLHGYASGEGPDEYNLNLSAHRAMAIKGRLEKLLPLGSVVTVFAHGESRHFGSADGNRRVGVSLIGPVASAALKTPSIMSGHLQLGDAPRADAAPGAPTRSALMPTHLPQRAPFMTGGMQAAPFLTVPPMQRTPRSLMDNAAMLAPSALHGAGPSEAGSIPELWDGAYLKYHGLGIPDTMKVGPVDLGAGALANKEVANGSSAYQERVSPSAVEQSNASVGAHMVSSPNLLDVFGKRKKVDPR